MRSTDRSLHKKLRQDKKGLELSINFIILLILAIVVFTMGLYIFAQIMSTGEEISGDINQETRDQIESILLEGNRDVVVPYEFATVPKDRTTTFALGLKSDTSRCASGTYLVTTTFDMAVDQENQDRTESVHAQMGSWYLEDTQSYTVKNNDRQVIGIPIRADASAARSGWTYVFNVKVDCQAGGQYGSLQKVYVIID